MSALNRWGCTRFSIVSASSPASRSAPFAHSRAGARTQVDFAALSLHQLEVVEDVREPVVPAAARVEDVLRGYADRQSPGVHDLEAVRAGSDICRPLSARAMDEGVDENLAND